MKNAPSVLLLLFVTALGSAACLTSSSTTDELQTDLGDIQSQVLVLQKEHADLRGQIAAQSGQLTEALSSDEQGQREERAEMMSRVEALRDEIEVLVQKLEDTNFRLSALSADIKATQSMFAYGQIPPGSQAPAGAADPMAPGGSSEGGTVVMTPPTRPVFTSPPSAPPDEIYNTAYADYTKGNYPLAILGFQEYAEKFGDTEFADDALYWIGESYYSQGKFADAIQSFEDLLRRYPTGDKVPAAHLKKGFAFLEMNRTAQGVVQLSALVENFPHTDEARLARERLRTLGLKDH